jgi:hypothetical protein
MAVAAVIISIVAVLLAGASTIYTRQQAMVARAAEHREAAWLAPYR